MEGCDNGDCMGELEMQLSTIFITNFFLNFLELGLPWAKNLFTKYRERKKVEKMAMEEPGRRVRQHMTFTEKQGGMSEYSSTLEDYMELIIQYGYVILFSSAFTLTPLFAVILCVVEIRVDAFKICTLERRPFPHGRESIGQWNNIISLLSMVGVFVNAGIICFPANVFKATDPLQYWFAFFVIDHILLAFKGIIAWIIPDQPSIVRNSKAWQKRIVDERLFCKNVDIDKMRKARNLEMEGDIEPVKFARESILEDNEELQ